MTKVLIDERKENCIQCPTFLFLKLTIQGFGIAVMVAIAFFVVVGFASVFVIKGKSENFFVAGRSLPLWVSSFSK